MTGVFPSVLQTAKVVPVFKKDSKLDYSDYRPISLLSNIKKIHCGVSQGSVLGPHSIFTIYK